jgi:hypothetical protein
LEEIFDFDERDRNAELDLVLEADVEPFDRLCEDTAALEDFLGAAAAVDSPKAAAINRMPNSELTTRIIRSWLV